MNKIYWKEHLKSDYYRRFSEVEKNDSISEECGVFGVYSNDEIDTFSISQFGMFALQHRGQEACGVSVLKNGQIRTAKKAGLVLDMFKSINTTEDFLGNAAIGHTRYSTSGDPGTKNFQPFYATNAHGKVHMSFVHNGNMIELEDIRKELIVEDFPFLGDSDSEVLLRLIQKYFSEGKPIVEAVRTAVHKVKGAYSILILTKDEMVAFRDPYGIRPLTVGKIQDNAFVCASEDSALDAVGAKKIKDINPGELVLFNKDGMHSYELYPKEETKSRLCAFEYVYFARPDSVIQDIDVYQVRVESGKKLYEQSPVDADVVIGVPDSGVPAAVGFSKISGIPFEPILVKNRYMSRSFIIPTQEMRERVVNLKLNPIVNQVKGKRIVVIDDSIVRGTTSKRLVNILKNAGAKEVHFRSASPQIIAPCFLGIDMPSKKDLISSYMDKEALKKYLEVDSLDFLTVENLTSILKSNNHCFGCFTEKYPINKN